MKRLVACLLGCVVLISAGCDAGGTEDPSPDPDYYVTYRIVNSNRTVEINGRMALGGTESGLAGVPASTEAASFAPGEANLWVFCSSSRETVDAAWAGSGSFVHLCVTGDDPISAGDYQSGQMYIRCSGTKTFYDYSGDDFSVTITRYDDVGGVVEGTYSVRCQDVDGFSYTATGSFKVLRGPDDSSIAGFRIR